VRSVRATCISLADVELLAIRIGLIVRAIDGAASIRPAWWRRFPGCAHVAGTSRQ
jgi:hypothetical protein